jgi:hypothetical protein
MHCSKLFIVNILILLTVSVFIYNGYLEGFSAAPAGPEVVYLYWKNCGHCKTFMSEWSAFESLASANGIKTIKLEMNDAGVVPYLKLAQDNKIFKGYPCVYYLKSDLSVSAYSGARKSADLLAWAKKF